MTYLVTRKMEQIVGDSNCEASVRPKFSFAFNNAHFSDRILHIDIMHDPQGGRHQDITDAVSLVCCSTVMDSSDSAPRVRDVYVNSAILAEKSPYFKKLFSNGMLESEERNISLLLSCSEKVAFMDLLQFIYNGTVEARSITEQLDVLMIADKFEVSTCVNHCSRALQNSPLTKESALLYQEIPSTLHSNKAALSLIDAAKRFLIQYFNSFKKFEEELMDLPLSGIEVVLSSDELDVVSEDVVYDFIRNWARKHYPDVDERRKIFGSKLCPLIRFKNMSNEKLREALSCNDLEASKAVIEALFMKAESPHKRYRYNERAYKLLPVTVVEYDAPHPQCMVVWNIHKEDCHQFSSCRETLGLYFRDFVFAGLTFRLYAYRFGQFPSRRFTVQLDIFDGEKDDEKDGLIDFEFQIRSANSNKKDLEFKDVMLCLHTKKFLCGRVNMKLPGVFDLDRDPSQLLIHGICYFRLWLTLKP